MIVTNVVTNTIALRTWYVSKLYRISYRTYIMYCMSYHHIIVEDYGINWNEIAWNVGPCLVATVIIDIFRFSIE